MENILDEQISNARKASMNGAVVVYDLTSGIDFSNPRKTGEALARVIFEQDVSRWVKVEGNKITINPSTKLDIRIMDDHNKAIDKTMNDFKKDMEKDELRGHYSQQIEAAANYQAGIASYLFLGIGTSLLLEHMERSSEKSAFVDDLMYKLMANISVTSLQ